MVATCARCIKRTIKPATHNRQTLFPTLRFIVISACFQFQQRVRGRILQLTRKMAYRVIRFPYKTDATVVRTIFDIARRRTQGARTRGTGAHVARIHVRHYRSVLLVDAHAVAWYSGGVPRICAGNNARRVG